MNRHRRDIDDDEIDLLGHDEARRVREEREHRQAEAKRIAEKNAEVDAALEAAIERRRQDLAKKGTELFLIEGYRKHEVEPPSVTGEGVPTCSIDVLFSLGWRVVREEFEMPKLVRPAHIGAKPQTTEGS